MKSLDLLRSSTGFLDSVEGSTAMAPYAHLVRDLLDTRPRSAKIEYSIRRVFGSLTRDYDERAVTAVVRARLEQWLPLLPLAEIPCDKTIRRALRSLDQEKKGNFGGQVPPGFCATSYASTMPINVKRG